MKKGNSECECKIILNILLVFCFAIAVSLFLSSAMAAELTDASNPTAVVVGTNSPAATTPVSEADLEKLQQIADKNPEELAAESSTYLRSQWAVIIQNKFPFLWTIHESLLAHQTPFKVLFNREYSFSWAFLFVIILWLYLLEFGSKIFDAFELIKQKIGIIIGIMLAVIVSWTGAINWLVERVSYLMTSQSAWWMRIVIVVIVFAVLALFTYISNLLKKYLEAKKIDEEKEEIKQKVEELGVESKGRKEGREITKPLREAKKKIDSINLGADI